MRRVLIVEDSVSTRAFVRAVLEASDFAEAHGGCQVVEASSGFDAMRLLPRGPYDLIVTDINGLELVRFIRKSAHHSDTPLVVISTLRGEHDADRALALGANVYLPKPFTPEQLRATCGDLLSRVPGRQSVAAPKPGGGA